MSPVTHEWNLSSRQAVALQKKLADQVILETHPKAVETVAGVDVGIKKGIAKAAVVVLAFPDLTVIDYAVASGPVPMPYIPGLLSFREGPVILEAMHLLSVSPDLLIFDGQGIAHPRRLGIASHLGVLLDRPTIGCAKSRLCGKHSEPAEKKGSRVPLHHNGEKIGTVLRTRDRVKPVFVSPGHRVDFDAAVDLVLACCTRYRLPETTRWAHNVAAGKIPPIMKTDTDRAPTDIP
ncbi:MAG: deoxyribonuclease V [Thermodesulfobacteriota bacterium]